MGVQFIFVRRQQRNCTFNQDFYQFASADGAKTKPIVAVTGWGFKCSNATVRARCAYIPGVRPVGTWQIVRWNGQEEGISAPDSRKSFNILKA